MPDYTKQYNKYAKDVVEGRQTAGECIKLACKRYLDWFDRKDIWFDEADVDRKIKFISLMKHFTGVHAGKPFILLPWQAWVIAAIFGFKWKTTDIRVTNKVFLIMSRKCGKTAFAAAISLIAALADKEPNAEIDCVANSRQQAMICFDMVSNFAQSLDPKRKLIHTYRNEIRIPDTKSKVQVLSSDSMGLDGYNSSVFILDEFHANKSWDLYNVLISSQGMRSQPLAIVITTAGFLLQGYPCYEYWQTCKDILKGLKQDDSQFSAIFQLDEGDDWQDEANWIKAVPSLGQTVTYKYMRDQIQTAVNQPAQEVGIKTKNLNMWCQSKEVWIPDHYIADNMQTVDLKQLIEEECFMGVDLSSVSDITAMSVLFPPNEDRAYLPDKYIFKTFTYLPESVLDESMNSEIYKGFKRDKQVNFTPGNVVDYDYILNDQMHIYRDHYLLNVAYDEWNATQWAIKATEEGLPLTPYSQALGNFNKPTKTFEMLLKQGKIVIDNNDVVRWAFGNVEIKTDWNENCKPVKAGNDQSKKIDPVIAMLQALGGMLQNKRFGDGLAVVV